MGTKIHLNIRILTAVALVSTILAVTAISPGATAQGATCLGQPVTVDIGAGQLPTNGADVIMGTPGDDSIAAMDGNDLICGGGGNDKIWGQGGNDSIDGGDGDDRLRGGAADDTLLGGPGNDDIAGGPGNDLVDGQDGDDTALRGGGGDDTVNGGTGHDALLAGNGGVDNLDGGPGNDKVTGGPRPDQLAGGAGDDELRGHKGADTMSGGAGSDALFGGPQPDSLDGGSGADICNGGTTGADAAEGDVAVNCESHLLVENIASGRSGLEQLSGCEEYLSHIKTMAGERVGPYGLEGVFGQPILLAEAVPVAAAPPQAAPDAAEAAVDFSETNNQVTGVDEPDIIKTDGRRIVAVHGNDIRVFEVNGSDATQIGSITLESSPRELVLDGDRVLVIGNIWQNGPFPLPVEPGGGPVPVPAVEPPNARLSIAPYGHSQTVITQLDISGAPVMLGQLELEGDYVSARKIGGVVRLVVSSQPGVLPFTYPMGPDGEQAAIDANLQIINDSELETWLGEYTLKSAAGDEIARGPLVPCDRIYRPDTFSGFEVLGVLTVNMQGDLTPGRGTGVITDGETVYASADSLYVATTLWPSFPIGGPEIDIIAFEDNYETALHRFDITNPTTANYVASGVAEGSLLNQFSLHEHDDRLFVASTQGSPWGPNQDSESFISVLEVDGDTLSEVGKVGNMGRGERIYAVRFIGETAYVVTFRQVDPLYVVDLSTPTAPVVTGELKIPGYSAYLHPVGEGLLLGVGQDATDDGRVTGAKVSLFDVSDPTNPIEQSVWTAPNSFSDAEWDHRAFLYWPAEDLAVLPIYQYQEQWAGAIALRIGTDSITEIARIDHAVDGELPPPTSTCDKVEGVEDIFGPGVIAEVCGPDDESSWPGFFCDRLEELNFPELGVELGPDEYLQICWPDGNNFPPQIQRTLVIGGSLWSMSQQYLQSNDIQSFVRTDRNPF